MIKLCFATSLSLAAAVPLSAQTPPRLDARLAQAVVNGCAAHAAAKMQSHAIVVVDPGGHVVASLRMDGTSSGMMDFARAKAEAVAAWGFSTRDMESSAKVTPGFAQAPHVVTVAGGLPILSAEGRLLGAAGASGEAPPDDEACVAAGIAAAGFKSQAGH